MLNETLLHFFWAQSDYQQEKERGHLLVRSRLAKFKASNTGYMND
jgi:hypothetical protein